MGELKRLEVIIDIYIYIKKNEIFKICLCDN